MRKSAATDALFVKAKEEEESRRMRLALLRTKQQVWVHAGGNQHAVEEATWRVRDVVARRAGARRSWRARSRHKDNQILDVPFRNEKE